MSVWSFSRANSTARLDGAETAATIGSRPASDFCMISNDDRPLTRRMWRSSGKQIVEQRVADDLVDRVVPADVLAEDDHVAVRCRRGRPRAGRRCGRRWPAICRISCGQAAEPWRRRRSYPNRSAERRRGAIRSSPCRRVHSSTTQTRAATVSQNQPRLREPAAH